MKKSVSKNVIILVAALAVIIIGMIFWKGAGPGKNEKVVDDYFKNSPMSGMSGQQSTQPVNK